MYHDFTAEISGEEILNHRWITCSVVCAFQQKAWEKSLYLSARIVHQETNSWILGSPQVKTCSNSQTSQSPNRQLRQWHSTASPEELGPWDHKICGEITKDSKRSRICPRKGKAVLTPQMRFEEMQEGTLACCLAFLGLLLSFFSRELAALIPYSAGANLPQEAQRPQKCRFPWSLANKMVGNTQGL